MADENDLKERHTEKLKEIFNNSNVKIRRVILVEGLTEIGVLSIFLQELGNISLDKEGISLIPVNEHKNFENFINSLLKEFHTPCFVLANKSAGKYVSNLVNKYQSKILHHYILSVNNITDLFNETVINAGNNLFGDLDTPEKGKFIAKESIKIGKIPDKIKKIVSAVQKWIKKTQTIKDLVILNYGSNEDGKNIDVDGNINYHNEIWTEIISPQREVEIKRLFSIFGKVEKIKEKSNKKTSDFEIKNKKILIEVTSINATLKGPQNTDGSVSLNLPLTLKDVIDKINRCIYHTEEKESYEGFYKIVIVFIDSINYLSWFRRLCDDHMLDDVIKQSKFPNSEIKAILFKVDDVCMEVGEHASKNNSIMIQNKVLKPILGYAKTLQLKQMLDQIPNSKIKILG